MARTVLKQVIAGNGNNFDRDPKTLAHIDVSVSRDNQTDLLHKIFPITNLFQQRPSPNIFIKFETIKQF
jgi:hypothetical protein